MKINPLVVPDLLAEIGRLKTENERLQRERDEALVDQVQLKARLASVDHLRAEIERLKAFALELTDALDNALNFGADRTLINRARRELEPKP